MATYFQSVNRNKSSVVLDLGAAADLGSSAAAARAAPTCSWRTSGRA